MSGHLNAEQFSELVLGQANANAARHVRDCAACRRELADFREALGEFRSSVRAWSAEQADRALLAPASEPRLLRAPAHQLGWALAIAAMFVIASFVFSRHGAERAAANDAALLNQVDSEVSQTVPSSLQPLMKLVVQQ